MNVMQAELEKLRIDRSKKPVSHRPGWIAAAVSVAALAGLIGLIYARFNEAVPVQVVRVCPTDRSSPTAENIILNATGYIVAAHRIEVASRIVGRVAWIGVEKGDKVKAGQALVRLEDDEYRAQAEQASGQMASLEAQLLQLERGFRPEEIAVARANLREAEAALGNARVNLERAGKLAAEGVLERQALDDAQARHESQSARVNSLERTVDLAVLGPRPEEIAAARGRVAQARGAIAYAETQLANAVIRAPVSGTVLERGVEKGEFVTTMFVGDRGAKSYVVALADLNDLEVELDISQNDFARLSAGQKSVITTEAFPDRKYDGRISEISPEANRQKATVQVKVKILNPDDYLRPEMNASVAFYSKPATGAPHKPTVVIPAAAVRDSSVFLVVDGRAFRRSVEVAGTTAHGTSISGGLIGGEDVVVDPPANLKDGQKVRQISP
jgi:HlyD family secretion protein